MLSHLLTAKLEEEGTGETTENAFCGYNGDPKVGRIETAYAPFPTCLA